MFPAAGEGHVGMCGDAANGSRSAVCVVLFFFNHVIRRESMPKACINCIAVHLKHMFMKPLLARHEGPIMAITTYSMSHYAILASIKNPCNFAATSLQSLQLTLQTSEAARFLNSFLNSLWLVHSRAFFSSLLLIDRNLTATHYRLCSWICIQLLPGLLLS